MFHVGRTLRRIREHAGLAAAEVARRAGFAPRTLTNAESLEFSTLGAKNLAQVLGALGLTHNQWIMLLAADWDGSSSGWNRYLLISASHLLSPRRLSELVHKAEQLCHEEEIELPHDLPKPPPEASKPARLLSVRGPGRPLPGGHVEHVARVFEVTEPGPPKKGPRSGSSALPATGGATGKQAKARKRGPGAA